MLDLKKLEKQLDEALAKETKETLLRWLKEKNHENTPESYGGDYWMDGKA